MRTVDHASRRSLRERMLPAAVCFVRAGAAAGRAGRIARALLSDQLPDYRQASRAADRAGRHPGTLAFGEVAGFDLT
jgi:hypothetical protein